MNAPGIKQMRMAAFMLLIIVVVGPLSYAYNSHFGLFRPHWGTFGHLWGYGGSILLGLLMYLAASYLGTPEWACIVAMASSIGLGLSVGILLSYPPNMATGMLLGVIIACAFSPIATRVHATETACPLSARMLAISGLLALLSCVGLVYLRMRLRRLGLLPDTSVWPQDYPALAGGILLTALPANCLQAYLVSRLRPRGS